MGPREASAQCLRHVGEFERSATRCIAMGGWVRRRSAAGSILSWEWARTADLGKRLVHEARNAPFWRGNLLSYRFGFDVGGTFTDLVLCDEATGILSIGKALTVLDDPVGGVLQGLADLLEAQEIEIAALTEAVHATTMVTNQILERSGDPVALITTRGFRDVLEIGRQKRNELYNIFIEKVTPIIRRSNVWEVNERLNSSGGVIEAVRVDEIRRVVSEISARGIQSVAVCLLHSYVNPAHERAIGTILREMIPRGHVSLSSEVSPIFREYERTNTAAVCAYLMPTVSRYFGDLRDRLTAHGFKGTLSIMQSNGGVTTVEDASRYPVRLIESGPAAGAIMAAKLGVEVGIKNAIAFDMGGTTAKLTLIEDGRPMLIDQLEVDRVNARPGSGLVVNTPSVDLVEIGAGGGSIASVANGLLLVGPESAGSRPGPACYGLGGSRPTVTDANLVLGYLNPSNFLGGKMRLDLAAARNAIDTHIASRLGVSVEEAAWGIHEVVNNNMALASRVVSVGRGKDPRDLALIPFGGAGPVHGARLARLLGCTHVFAPLGAGATAAQGMIMSDPLFTLGKTAITRLASLPQNYVPRLFEDLETRAKEFVAEAAITGAWEYRYLLEMRFTGQGNDLSIDISHDMPKVDEALLRTRFLDQYRRVYSRVYEHDPIQITGCSIHAFCLRPTLPMARALDQPGPVDRAKIGLRNAFFPEGQGYLPTPVYDRYKMAPNDLIIGPAIVEERETTLVLLPGDSGFIDAHLNLKITSAEIAKPISTAIVERASS